MQKNEIQRFAIPIVLFAGVLWSFGPYVVRQIDDAASVPWQYLFTRGTVIFLILNCYLFFTEGIQFYKNYLRIGLSGLLGGIGLGTAMITFIWSITNTSAAITLLCLAAMPFITALLQNDYAKKKNLTRFANSQILFNQKGKLKVKILKDQESFRIKSFLHSNSWTILDLSLIHI